jgi:hypothetical protein
MIDSLSRSVNTQLALFLHWGCVPDLENIEKGWPDGDGISQLNLCRILLRIRYISLALADYPPTLPANGQKLHCLRIWPPKNLL